VDKEFTLGRSIYLEAIEFIKEKHDDQFRAFSLAPYWTHPIRVAALVMKYKESHKIDDLVLAALLHDVVEDTDTTLFQIDVRYGQLVASLVDELTSNKAEQNEMGKTAYLCNKMVHMSDWGLVIKLCDRLDNVTDFAFAPTKFVNKYAKETTEIIAYLRAHYILTQTQSNIIRDIEKMVAIYWKEMV